MRSSAFFVLVYPAVVFAGEPRFVPVFLPVDHQYTGGWEHFVGGGVASFDCNGDHYPDAFVAGGTSAAILLRNSGTAQISFVEDTPEALSLTAVTGAYPLDIDSDGIVDLAILRVGENLLMRGHGNCEFSPFDAGFADRHQGWTTAFSATWEAGQTLPTLAFGNYVDQSDADGPFEACDDNVILRPEGSGYTNPIVLRPGYCALSMLFTDWARSGKADLRVSNDRHYYVREGEEQLWAMRDVPVPYGAEDGWNSHQLWGMGIASRDISGDGRAEVYLTSMGDQHLHSLVSDVAPSYQNAPFARGVSAHRPHMGDDGRPSTGWHAAFADVNNDGLDDIFVAKGNVDQMMDAAMADPNSLLLQKDSGDFIEMASAAGVASMARSRGAALVDFNRDGRLDLLVVNRRDPLQIWQNVTDGGNWIFVSLQQFAPNVNAVGAFIELDTGGRVQTREITVGGGHASGSLGPEHFGLGDAESASIRVIWPDGDVGAWMPVSANTEIVLSR